ncbi:MAG: leucyl aminopeptidase [Candidatus Eiseniibacteriota bacterium]
MQITIRGASAEGVRADALAVGLFEGAKRPATAAGVLDEAASQAIAEVLKTGDFTGKNGQVAVLYPTGGHPSRLLLIGLGPDRELSAERVRQAAGHAITRARSMGFTTLATLVHGLGHRKLKPAEAAAALVEGSILGNYVFSAYLTQDKERKRQVESLVIVGVDAKSKPAVTKGAGRGRIVAEGVCLTRDLASRPGQDMTPADLATSAREVAGRSPAVRATIFGPDELKRMKMGALLGVGRGSANPPRLIMLDYKPKGAVRKTVCLIGKGITFDTGGISLKPAEGMEKMKYDMSGGAAVIGALDVLGRLKPAGIRVIGLVCAAENMPGGRAVKPGDVLRASNGMTIEVNNTDAEGRLVLSDGLSYAHRFKPDAVLDIATLTGAVVIALGGHCSGIMGNDQKLVDFVMESGERTGERLWQLPTWPEYNDLLKSDVADMKNSAGREAGTIAGGMFLQKFANGYKWCHLDIAGTAWNDRDKPYAPRGSAGVGVRLFVDFVERMAVTK